MMLNSKSRKIIEVIIIIWIVLDIIILTSLYFINVSSETYFIILIFDTSLCIALFIEFTFRMKSKINKKQYVKENWNGVIVDIVSMVPYEVLTFGSFGFIRLLRLVRIFGLFEKGKKNIFNFIGKTKLNYILFTLIIIIAAGSIAMLVLESSPNDKINTPIDALWYIVSTVSTVGYGDITPESPGGKLLGIILMIIGVGFFSLLTARLSSWFVKEEEETDELKAKIVSMEDSINELKSEIQELKELLKKK